MSDPPPRLSVIVVVGPLRERAAGCVASLLGQEELSSIEVLLIDCRSDLAAVDGSGHPAVRVLPMPASTSFTAARLAGIRAARGRWVALVEEHSRVMAGWAKAVISAHEQGWTAVASEMHCHNPGVGASDVNGVMNYGLFGPPMRAGEGELAPPFHTSFERSALLALGPALDELGFSDIFLMNALRRRGGRLYQQPAAKISHINETNLLAPLCADFHYHRAWARVRAREEGWSPLRRLAVFALAPLYPLYYLRLHVRRLRQAGQAEQAALLLRHPVHVVLRQMGPAIGQVVGLLLGPGRAAERFTRYEIVEPRRGAA